MFLLATKLAARVDVVSLVADHLKRSAPSYQTNRRVLSEE
jgi:hypothetical protein